MSYRDTDKWYKDTKDTKDFSSEKTVAVVTSFLVDRAKLGRVTTFKEVAYVVGKAIGTTPERRKVAKALAKVAANSYASDGVILPALVVHWNDNRPGHRFAEWASTAGLNTSNVDELHTEQLDTIFELAQKDKLSHGAHWKTGDRRVNLDASPKRESLFA